MTQSPAQDLLDSIFRLATELVRGERMSLMLREEASTDFVIARAIGLAEDVKREVRVREGVGVAGRVAASRQALLVGGPAGGPANGAANGAGPAEGDNGDRRYRSASFMVVPIIVDGEARGVINVADHADGRPFHQADLEMLQLLASHIGACLVQRDQGEALERLAETDPLTWLFNRRHFDRRLEAETNRAARSDALLAVLMIDVDRFKSYNDRYGHRVGDLVLRAVAAAIGQAVRPYDVPTRYGGDEFAIILPEADTEVGGLVAQRILERVAQVALPKDLATAGETIGLSIGIATFPRPAVDQAALVEAADAAMYSAKEAGGGVRVWEHSIAEGPRGHLGGRHALLPFAPYLAEPGRLARPELQALLPATLAAEHNAVVVGRESSVLTVALPEPDAAAMDAISRATGLAIYPVYSNAADLAATRRRLSA